MPDDFLIETLVSTNELIYALALTSFNILLTEALGDDNYSTVNYHACTHIPA